MTLRTLVMNSDSAGGVITASGGEYALCRMCESYAVCNHNGPRILPPVRLVLRYLNEARNGLPGYPWPGDWRCQPEWFMDLLIAARQAEAQAWAEKRALEEKKYGNRNT